MEDMLAVETYGSVSREVVLKPGVDGKIAAQKDSRRWTSIQKTLRSVFLPHGYPDSVSEDYLQYQIWDTLQAFCSSITSTLATQAVLIGVGVGDENATVLAATLTWLMKDGTGMVGRILFAWLQGLFADILNDFATFLEILAPAFKEYFTLVICVAGVCKSMVGVAGGATRAALTQHQARRNNMADVSAKDGSQETLVNLAGLLCSLALVPLVTGQQTLIWCLFLIFTAAHLYSNYRAVRSVRIETFNQSRLHIVMTSYLNDMFPLYSVKEANLREPVVFKQQRLLQVDLGSSISAQNLAIQDFQKLKSIFRDSKYLICLDTHLRRASVSLHKSCTTMDQLQACFHCDVIEHVISNSAQQKDTVTDANISSMVYHVKAGRIANLLEESLLYTKKHFNEFINSVTARGWSVDSAQLGADEWRADWNHTKDL